MINTAVEGIVTVTRYHAPSGTVRERRMMKNMITDYGLDSWIGEQNSVNDLTHFVGVGTGTAPTAAGDLELHQFAGARTNRAYDGNGDSGSTTEYGWLRRAYYFEEGEVVNLLGEIGWFREVSGPNMFNRVVISDDSGMPSPIMKLIDEQLVVELEFRIYPPTWETNADDVQGTVLLNGVTHNFRVRPLNLAGPAWHAGNTGWLTGGALAEESDDVTAPSTEGAVVGPNTTAVDVLDYTPGTFTIDVIYTWGALVGNFTTGIGKVSAPYSASEVLRYPFQIQFTPKIDKDPGDALNLRLRFAFTRR